MYVIINRTQSSNIKNDHSNAHKYNILHIVHNIVGK